MDTGTLETGALPPPPGIKPNFDAPDHDAYRDNYIIQMIVCYTLTVIFCVIRGFIKAVRWEMLPDDWLCILSLAFVTLQLVANIKMWVYGMGFHIWDIKAEAYINLMKWNYIGSATYIPAVFATKTAILLLLARIFAINELVARSIRIFIWLLLLTVLPIECLKLASCKPISAYWQRTPGLDDHTARCLDEQSLYKADITIAIITDLIIFLIPIPLTLTLSFPLRRKIRILLSLLSGSGAVGVAIYKGFLIFHPSGSNDSTWNGAILIILTWLEINIGLICACVPSVNILIDIIRRKTRSSTRPTVRAMNTFKRQEREISKGLSTGKLSTFDTELAMLSGETATGAKHTRHSRVETDGRCKRIDSSDGRREGWLKV